MNGIGKRDYEDGRTYFGQWKYDDWHGYGMYQQHSGIKFYGNELYGAYIDREGFLIFEGPISDKWIRYKSNL